MDIGSEDDYYCVVWCFSERYEVIDSAPRISIHADIIQEDQVTNWLPNGSPRHCKNLFVMALLEKTTEYIFSADSMCVSLITILLYKPVYGSNA